MTTSASPFRASADTTATAFVLVLLGLPVLLGCIVLMDGFIIRVLWAWFAVPIFGAPALPLAAAVGLSALGSALVSLPSDYARSEQSTLERLAWPLLTKPALLLGIGWVAHLFL